MNSETTARVFADNTTPSIVYPDKPAPRYCGYIPDGSGVEWNAYDTFQMEEYARRTWAAAFAAKPEIYEAYKSWPKDIRKKLSLHDLRRMTGWVASQAIREPTQDECNRILREYQLREGECWGMCMFKAVRAVMFPTDGSK